MEEHKESITVDSTLTEEEQKEQIEEELTRQGYNNIKVEKNYDDMKIEDVYYFKYLKQNLEEVEMTLVSLEKRKKVFEYELSLIQKVKGNNREIYNKINRNLMPMKENIKNYKVYRTFYRKLKKVLDEERS